MVGIDLAKNTFHLHGVNGCSQEVLRKKLSRGKLMAFMANLPPCLVGMEACGGSHDWARKFRAMGHDVRLMSPQFVKPYVKSNKNDMVDAEAICEAVGRPNMRFDSGHPWPSPFRRLSVVQTAVLPFCVPIKGIEQQDIQSLHRAREQAVKNRTAQSNQIRGLLMEYGMVSPACQHNASHRAGHYTFGLVQKQRLFPFGKHPCFSARSPLYMSSKRNRQPACCLGTC